MANPKKKTLPFFTKLRNKYRLVILNDETFQERLSFKLSRLNVYVFFSTVFIVLLILMACLIVFTPIRYYIPGYGDVNFRQELIAMRIKTDSLEEMVQQRNLQMEYIKKVLSGEVDTTGNINERFQGDTTAYQIEDDVYEAGIAYLSNSDLEDISLNVSDVGLTTEQKEALALQNLFPPVQGYVTGKLDISGSHFGIDLVAPIGEPIKAVKDGVIIQANWTLETGYVIGIQHEGNLLSFYKHNSALLKKVGSFVKAGDVIATLGSSGELTSGPHLHFELWQNGEALDPLKYLNLN